MLICRYYWLILMALPLSYNVRNLRQRWKVTLLAIFGIGLVVAVFVALLSMENGFRIALRSTGSPLNGIVTQRGSMSELTSWINIGDVNVITSILASPATADGKPMASCEVVILATRRAKADKQPANITFRGVTPMAFNVRNNIKIVEGRTFTPGLYEVIVGKKIADRVSGLDIGSTISMQKQELEGGRACSPPTAAPSKARSGATTMPWRRPSAATAAASR